MDVPRIVVAPPGPKSLKIWEEEKKYITPGLSVDMKVMRRGPVVFERGEGSLLWDVDGNCYIDFAAGVLTNSTGNCHPKIVQKFTVQVKKLWHVHDNPTPERVKLLKILLNKTPEGIDTFEFYSGGSETVEAAMKAATSYTHKYEFISFYRGFHGKTLGTRTICPGFIGKGFGPVMNAVRVPCAYCYRCFFGLKYPGCQLHCADFIKEAVYFNASDDIAAMVFEPVMGAGGVIIPPKGFWNKVVEFCRQNNILLIADEILAGVGRTGKFFSFEHFGIEPDLITFGKGMGSGYPVMVLAGRKKIMSALPFARPGGASTSFGGNALAVAAALATLETIEEEKMLDNACKIGEVMGRRLNEMKDRYSFIGDVRGLGALWALEFVKDRQTKEPAPRVGESVAREAFNHGLRTIHGGTALRLSPALNTPIGLIEKGLDILDTALSEVEKQ